MRGWMRNAPEFRLNSQRFECDRRWYRAAAVNTAEGESLSDRRVPMSLLKAACYEFEHRIF